MILTSLIVPKGKQTYFAPFAIFIILMTMLPVKTEAAVGETILRLHGSNTIGAKLGPDIAKRFLKHLGYTNIRQARGEKENEYYIVGSKEEKIFNIEVQAHGSSTSFRNLEAGLCDVGMASRRIKDVEVKKLAFLGDMTSIDNEHILAIDGIAVIVNSSNKIDSLTVTTIQKIFTGQISNWKEIGGKDDPIHVYSRDDNSGTYDTFKNMVLKKIPLTANAKRYESNAKLSDDVAKDPAGIGFVGMPYVQQSKALKVKNTKGGIGFLPTTFSAACEEYPLSRRLYLYTVEKPKNPLARQFVQFALSYEGQKSAALLGFAQLSLDMEEHNNVEDRFLIEEHKNLYAWETRGGRRVNFNFRFNTANNTLENRSQKDLERFIRYIQQRDQYYYEPLLIGINSCFYAEMILSEIIKVIGINNFHVPPKMICLDYAVDSSNTPLEPLVEVWLRLVDDGA